MRQDNVMRQATKRTASPRWSRYDPREVKRVLDEKGLTKVGPVLDLLLLVARNEARSPTTDRARAEGRQAAVDAAIVSGMRWTCCDAAAIRELLAIDVGKYRFRIDLNTHARAVGADNLSAAKSIEQALGIEPWLWSWSRTAGPGADGFAKRAHIGGFIPWQTFSWRVNSMTNTKINLSNDAGDRKSFTRKEWAEAFPPAPPTRKQTKPTG